MGFRLDIIEAMKKIKVPILRWPGGCFVSSYHWKDAVGKDRQPFFDKAWRVEDPNTFGTDEYVKLCKKIGCEPYICTNAGTGTAEEMSDWVEYCNLECEGKYAKWRIENGYTEPHKVKYWSIGNENYGHWEIGAKSADEWGRLVKESAKMMKHVDPETELSAAALSDIDWNINLLRNCGMFLDWISIHEYWDMMPESNTPASYEQCMAFTHRIDHAVDEVRGILTAMKLEKQIKIAFDEWNLRSWHHPNVHTIKQGVKKEDYVTPRDKNDDNSMYTMTVPHKNGTPTEVETLDLLATKWSDREGLALAAVNKHMTECQTISLSFAYEDSAKVMLYRICGKDKDSYNDVDRTEIQIEELELGLFHKDMKVELAPHSVSVIQIM